jgi:arylformamidase
MMNKWIDISWPITPEMTTYKNKHDVQFEYTKTFEKDHVRESRIIMGSHTGTHIDAPSHFLQKGETIDQLALDLVIGTARVLDCMQFAVITKAVLTQWQFNEHEIILFKTTNSLKKATDPFDSQFVSVAADAAHYLAEKRVKAVGIDYLGIERNQPDHDTHTILMQHGIAIIEGLRLAAVEPGIYFFLCVPLAVQGLEAAPARALLAEQGID